MALRSGDQNDVRELKKPIDASALIDALANATEKSAGAFDGNDCVR